MSHRPDLPLPARSATPLDPLLPRGDEPGSSAAALAASAGLHRRGHRGVSRAHRVHALPPQRDARLAHLRRGRAALRSVRRVPPRGGGIRRRRSHRPADAELPGVSDRGLRLPQGRARDGQHESALYDRRDDAPVRRQRRRRAGRDRRLRQQGGRCPAEDVDSHRRPRERRGSPAAAEALRRAQRAALREEDGAAGDVRARHVSERARARRRADRRTAPIRRAIARRSRTTASRRCSTPAARPASPRARCSRTGTCSRTSPAASKRGSRIWSPAPRCCSPRCRCTTSSRSPRT